MVVSRNPGILGPDIVISALGKIIPSPGAIVSLSSASIPDLTFWIFAPDLKSELDNLVYTSNDVSRFDF